MKHLYHPEECPNYPHGHHGQPAPKGTCPLCGRNSRAFVAGERIAAGVVVGLLVVVGTLTAWGIIALTLWVASW